MSPPWSSPISTFLQAGPLTDRDADSVPLAQPFLNGRELELVGEVVRSGQLVNGPMLERFERAFAQAAGVAAVVAVSSRQVGVHAMAAAALRPRLIEQLTQAIAAADGTGSAT